MKGQEDMGMEKWIEKGNVLIEAIIDKKFYERI